MKIILVIWVLTATGVYHGDEYKYPGYESREFNSMATCQLYARIHSFLAPKSGPVLGLGYYCIYGNEA